MKILRTLNHIDATNTKPYGVILEDHDDEYFDALKWCHSNFGGSHIYFTQASKKRCFYAWLDIEANRNWFVLRWGHIL